MVEAHRVYDVDRDPERAPRRREIVRLAVVLGPLVGADGEHERRAPGGLQMHRAVAPRGLGREPQHVVEIAETYGLEVVEAADGAAGLHDVGGDPELRPVRRQQHRDQVAAGGVAGHRDARRVAAERARVGVHPRHRRAHLAHELVQVHRRHQRVVDDDGGGLAEGAGDEREVGLVEAVPVAAVDEDLDRRRAGPGGGKDVQALVVVRAVGHVEPHRELGPRPRALGAVAGDPVERVLHLDPVVVLGVERLPVVAAEDRRRHPVCLLRKSALSIRRRTVST